MKKELVGSIYETEDYKEFKMVTGNRLVDVNSSTFKKLVYSIKASGQFIPAMVTPDMRVIDGQNRLMACSFAGKPFKFFIVDKDVPEDAVQTVNTISKNWTRYDYLNYYTKLGNPHYKIITDQLEQFNDFALTTILKSMNVTTGSKFDMGLTEVSEENVELSNNVLTKVSEFKDLFEHYNARPFVAAYMEALNNPLFVHQEFYYKLEANPNRLEKQASIKEYLRNMEDVYNFHLNRDNRIRLY